MSSKVIKWFKRQASIRRHSDKSEEKSSSSNTKSEEKRKTSFPRLSFRKRNKRKGSDIEGGFSIIGISKKFSFSVPKEMESRTKEPSLDSTRVPTSQSTNFGGSVSLTNSPNRMGDQSVCSDFSDQSSFGNSKENTVSSNGNGTSKVEPNKNECESISRTFNCSSNQQSHHCVSGESKSNSSLNNFYENTKQENAPIVKMEEICDSYSDREHPEETQSITAIDSSINSVSIKAESKESVHANEAIETNDHILYDNLNLELIKLKCDESVLYIEEEMDSNLDSIKETTKEEEEEKPLENVFEEIDRLVKDATTIAEIESNDGEITSPQNSNDREISEKNIDEIEETEISKCSEETHDSSNTETDENVGNSDSTQLIKEVELIKEELEDQNKDNQKIHENSRNSSEDISTLSVDESYTGISHIPTNAVNSYGEVVSEEEPISTAENNIESASQVSSSNNNEVIEKKAETHLEANENAQLEPGHNVKDFVTEEPVREIELKITEESDLSETNASPQIQTDVKEVTNSENFGYKSSPSPVQIIFTHPSPVRRRREAPKKVEEKLSANFYPKELNPFGEEEEEAEVTTQVPTNHPTNFEVTPRKMSRTPIKENESTSFQRETPQNNFSPLRNMKSSSSSPQLKTSYRHEGQQRKGCSERSLNPFGDSDEEEAPPSLNSTNPFDEDDDPENNPRNSSWGESPPRLPPKSVDPQIRKNSRGYLPPVPHPRRSKQSHHGSYTSLQNVSTTAPIPAPRSFTPFGSTKTLDYSLNPFDDDADDEGADFVRRGVGRSSLQALPFTSPSQDPFSRTPVVRGSLPPTSIIKFNRKKRPAPLPPGFNQNKPTAIACDFSSLPRRRYSSSASDMLKSPRKYHSSSREQSPQRLPPPRPPPPKLNYY